MRSVPNGKAQKRFGRLAWPSFVGLALALSAGVWLFLSNTDAAEAAVFCAIWFFVSLCIFRARSANGNAVEFFRRAQRLHLLVAFFPPIVMFVFFDSVLSLTARIGLFLVGLVYMLALVPLEKRP